jgi:hypothetical protein
MSRLRLPRVRLPSIWWALPMLLSYAMLSLAPLREGDLWWHLKLGEATAMTRTLPTVDAWTVAGSGQPFNAAHSWLSGVAFYILTGVGGLGALVVAQAIVGTLTVAIMSWLSYRAGAAPPFATVLALTGFVALYPFSTARPQMFSFFLFAALYAVLSAAESGHPQWLGLAPPIMLLWVNLHGAWVMGLGLMGVFCLGWMIEASIGRREWRSLRAPAFWMSTALLTTCINPHGPRVYQYLVTMGTSPVSQQYVSEWQPPSLTQTFTWPFWLLLFVGIALLLRRPRRLDTATLAASVFVVLALRYMRMIPFAVIAFLPVLVVRLPQRLSVPGRATAINGLLLGTLLLLSILTTPYVRLAAGASPTSLIDTYFPVVACEILEKHAPAGSGVFTMPEWGGYVSWRLAPRTRSFVDGRIELPPASLWDEYVAIASGQPGWETLLQQWELDYLLLSRERHTQLATSAQGVGWQVLYADAEMLLLARP